jgi:hypothetical protein
VQCGAQDALAPVDGLTGEAGIGVDEPDRGEQVRRQQRGLGSVAIASNESFGGWTRTFTDPRLCADCARGT